MLPIGAAVAGEPVGPLVACTKPKLGPSVPMKPPDVCCTSVFTQMKAVWLRTFRLGAKVCSIVPLSWMTSCSV